METKPLLYGLIGFFLGGLLVAVAASTDRPSTDSTARSETSMSQMTRMLKDANGDEYDALFLRHMIDHHQAALDMAKLSADRAKHQDIKDMSNVIIDAQEKEIKTMKQWQIDWGYEQSGMPADHGRH